jgi:hypothetical protein
MACVNTCDKLDSHRITIRLESIIGLADFEAADSCDVKLVTFSAVGRSFPELR